MSSGVAWQGVCDATVQIPSTCVVHQTAGHVPRIGLILHMLHLQVNPYLVMFIKTEGRYCHGDDARVDAKFEVCSIALHEKKNAMELII